MNIPVTGSAGMIGGYVVKGVRIQALFRWSAI